MTKKKEKHTVLRILLLLVLPVILTEIIFPRDITDKVLVIYIPIYSFIEIMIQASYRTK